ncbi:leucyl/phenylalanyl-tRNA--protein transferase [Cellvibrio japonicus]|uniref:Leucyl/phenylalanyl-tRNA--protein transferase n=1 Tax=Cellvibrio japonicus (strain Ueda107) TaxID=498211 RepID=LFTR_CELJU|nr:leucyl/phenylalanyl-tRNA--protein transferase [Cellvibrio japonicus]B3PL51.1 RecName: Full=Leucyl/phenylalanyl-tRNA--protein transferase; AltName: Full=L/F-transferase; AltName: Full=Leucyltransferase; AltName: Full=Phenyalanyltransferase [Cellvibrio japonicus Ueda107]ACE85025.1 leucyl/phenylalanyl-tRNA--protein transferase [Cellvibrio japonicus Ueda107]QEI12939.1 leucyl/phenylalanyl-tRNA--protein transferase [Cellvibrio japonicus]QEI16513.1 leucyl/phenylalanyl-tRNA--protein transferase [Cel
MIPWLSPYSLEFPDVRLALDEPNGLLALGGDLSPERLVSAYQRGIFPWFNPGDPILWWSPHPRTVVFPHQHHVSRSLRKTLRKGIYRVTFDHCFAQVMRACAAPRAYANGTWISEQMISSYTRLHEQGYAHSVEVWQDENLVGGLYGLSLGKIFFGESMFSRADNASKTGFAYLVRQLQQWDFRLIDCQVASDHLFTLGAVEISRDEFQKMLVHFTEQPRDYPLHWHEIDPETRW